MNPLYTMFVRAILSVIFTSFYGVIVMHVLQQDVDFQPGVKDVLMFLLGALTTSLVGIIGFWFNSSQGSATTSATLREFVNNKGTTP
jgi:hypothetical protein